MTNKEILNHIKRNTYCDYLLSLEKNKKINKSIINALEKQIPRKPIDKDYILPEYDSSGTQCDAIFLYRADCPVCGNVLCDGQLEKSDMVEFKFCNNCGQAIDWSEENDNTECGNGH